MLGWLAKKGIPTSGRIAVGYAAEASEDGLFRKYGVFNIGGRLIPQHVMCAEAWVVKSAQNRFSAQTAAEELEFVRANPHRDILKRAFAMAGIDFGRIDYGIVAGRVQIYEINTNPYFPKFEKTDERRERRALIRDRLLRAFGAIDKALGRRGDFRFALPPRAASFELPPDTEDSQKGASRRQFLRQRIVPALANGLRHLASRIERMGDQTREAVPEQSKVRIATNQRNGKKKLRGHRGKNGKGKDHSR